MEITDFLSRLAKVRAMGPSKWQACCPAHDDRLPSLAVRTTPDGRLLVHCFGGCGTDAVMGALGLTLADLMPERLEHHAERFVRPWTGDDALRCLRVEASVVALMAADLIEGKEHSEADLARLCEAVGKIAKAGEYVDELG